MDDATTTAVGGESGGDADAARARAAVYGLLAAAFDGDHETLAAALGDGTLTDLVTRFPGDADGDALDRPDLDTEGLRVGYDNLFVVPGPHYVPPFASAWADDPSEDFESDSPYHDAGAAGELLGDPAAAAARSHAAVGFEPERGDAIPDHLAAELEFMRALCEREAALLADASDAAAEELAAVRERQRETVGRLGWLDDFHETVEAEDAAEGVFAALARLARTFVAWDARSGIAAPDSGTVPPQ
ncbi:TorD/DmsD family molecular chaperone [Halosimplex halobium]|uniref:TorD/DmsD family molecular chaperone n=1 Tax=Halosimplex halobium TaxID=3396618 RepID=UPI003F54B401